MRNCDEVFTNDTVAEMAQKIARHWNHDHDDELSRSMQAFDTEEYIEEQLHEHDHRARVYRYYVTAYDVINTDGNKPFEYQYVSEPEAEDHCVDCWRSIRDVDGYEELDDEDSWEDKYLCDRCAKRRKVERRQEENQSIMEFTV